jgi:hypothetical protein
MARGDKSKAERREAKSAGGPTKAERKQARAAGGATKAERREARAGRKGGAGPSAEAVPEDASSEERIEWRLARIEEAVAAQSQRSEELLARVNEMLEGGSEGDDATGAG